MAERWRTLQHKGVLFPPEYEPRGFHVTIRGKRMRLGPLAEEMIYQWAKKKDTPYVQDRTFQRNFVADFAGEMGPGFKGLKYADIGMGEAYRLVDLEKSRREMLTKEERKELAAERKRVREQLKAEYGTAVMDGKEVEVGNYMVEPAGIFIGRGEHPLRGRWKRRVTAADVTLNLGKRAEVPPGGWKAVVHNREATWLASWEDELTGKTKYIWLADTAGVKQERDKAKYDKALVLEERIGEIRESIKRDMARTDEKGRIATACYLIYRTAMRVGDEKDPDEADTVGATTLRKEHVGLSGGRIEFDFLGKDSVRWQEVIPAEGDDVQFHANLQRLVRDKGPKDEIFDGITSRHVNAYYSGIVKGLSAKVFRTYLATEKVRGYLSEHDGISGEGAAAKLYHAKMANLEAARMCNHKRTIPKNFDESLKKRRAKLREAEGKKPAAKARESLKRAKESKPKTPKQKKARRERIKRINEQVRRQEERHAERIERMRLQLDLVERTRDYNLGTSLRNYIDPRVVKGWMEEVGADWEKMYTAALQRKFLWVRGERTPWKELKGSAG
ncbi:2-alkenal reductase protein [Nitrosopumilaceae archaeon]|nr:DNA topoisomerase I [Nitrosopumilus sp.]CAI9831838.1 2-alkenal reductase protein [Nitrosopumilaceae archaeon]MDA7945129.1 DNA topoisomerase I [Nitrosopumilus sp.]MDA7955356.1 DNA topoisomerase I [Nitrosopumilus sp.]MDA7973742.1 DNA topoisomerase I [Nitrosopumilus sp.]